MDGPQYKRAVQMLFRIVTPRRSKSGSVTIRKGIPKDVRADYERLYGPGWEAKLTLPAGTPPQEAKVRIGEFTAEIETRIATIRAAKKGRGSGADNSGRHSRSPANGTSGTSVATRRAQVLRRNGMISGSHSLTGWKTMLRTR